MIESKNEQLRELYQTWKMDKYDQFIYENDSMFEKNKHLYSAPFYAGIPESYNPAKKTLLFVGQEARNWWPDNNSSTWEIENDFSVRYAESQLGLESEFENNRSPFWRLYRMLGIRYNMVWTNIDKVHRIGKNDNTLSLTVLDELFLNSSIGDSGKTVFQNEVDIIKPDVILFVTGPHYYKTMAKAIGIDDGILYQTRPTPDAHIKDISKYMGQGNNVFWSYHPGYLSRSGGFADIVEIVNSLSS